MFQLRRILLSGLVALLMVGMVMASDVGSTNSNAVVDSPIGGGHFGTMIQGECVDSDAYQCVKMWISIDIAWFIGLLT